MDITRSVLAVFACGLLCASLPEGVARADHPVDEALASAYAELKADPDLQDEASRHARLMEMANEYSQLAEAAFQSTEDLQSYAAKVRLTGLMLGRPLAKIKQFDKGLKRITEHPAFKAFQKYAALKGQASTVLDVGSRLTATLKNPDLPPSARNSLMALQVAATGLEQLSEVPLVGAALEGYGKVLSGLTDVMNDLASKASTTTKEGVFSRTEEAEQLQGLDPKQQFVKTPLWHRGIRLVQEYPFAAGQDRYYLQMPNGTWVGIADYDALAEVAADYYLTKKKNPDAQTLWKYFNDPDERDKLAFWAQVELENRRIEEVLGDLPGVDRKTRYTQFTEAQERIKRWYKGLGLPLEYDSLNRQIRLEVDNPGAVSKALRARVLRAYPGFADYLASAGVAPQSMDLDALIEWFDKYRRGEHLAMKRVGPDCFIQLPGDLPEGWWHVQTPVDAKGNNDGIPWCAYGSDEWRQRFTMSRDQGFVLRDGQYRDPSDYKRRFSSIWVTVHLSGPYEAAIAEQVRQGRIDSWIKEPHARYLNDEKKVIVLNYTQGNDSQHLIKLIFGHRGSCVFLQLSSRPGTNSDATEEMALYLADCLRRQLDRHFDAKP